MLNRKSTKNHAVESTAVAVDSGVITAIFSMFTTEAFQHALEGMGHLVLFPLAALISVLRSGLAIRQARLDNYKSGTLTRAIVELVTAIAVVTAVTGGLVAASVFVLASPIIFTATLGAKSLYNMAAAFYYWGKSAVKDIEPAKKTAYRAKVKSHLVAASILAMTTATVGLVMLGGHVAFAALGIAAGVLGIVYSAVNAIKSFKLIRQKPLAQPESISSAALIANGLQLSPENDAIAPLLTVEPVTPQRRGSLFHPAKQGLADKAVQAPDLEKALLARI